MKPSILWGVLPSLALYLAVPEPSSAKVRRLVTGDSIHEIQENAFKQGMDYPVGPVRCDQRCDQWWEKN